MRHTFTLVSCRRGRAYCVQRAWRGQCKVSGTLPDIRRANGPLLAVLRIPSSQLHVRNSRVSEALALPTLATQHAVLSLS